MIEFIVVWSLILGFCGIIYWGEHKLLDQNHDKTKHLLSDQQLLQLLSQANHFLTPQQLAIISKLPYKQAYLRLRRLTLRGVLQGHGTKNHVYQLKKEIPLQEQLPVPLQGLSEQQILNTILEYAPDYEVSLAELMIIFGVELSEAEALLHRLVKSNLVKRWRSLKGSTYIISSLAQKDQPSLKTKQVQKIALDTPIQKIRIPDADILELAVKHKGKLTPTRLCLDMKISLEEATEKLDSLHEKGIFTVDVHEENAIMEYHLLDKDLLE